MKRIFFPLMVTLLTLTSCASPTKTSPTQPSTSDQVATVVDATMQVPSTSTAEPAPELPTVDACQVPTFKASDMPSDCFNGSGEPDGCTGLDLLGVEAGLLKSVLEVADVPNLPTGFVVAFADSPQSAEEFVLYLYLDLDQNATTGLDMSSGSSALPGIDRLIGVTLPSRESWTQAVAGGAYDAEIIKDETQVSTRVLGDRVIVLVSRKLLEDKSVAAGEPIPFAPGSVVPVGYALGGALPDAFTLYVGTTRRSEALDFFNGDQDIHSPLAMTVSWEALYPPCPGGS